ncbi:MAG: hypothetical protein R3F49_07320 [Planctomycetota bacterium]
MTPLQRTLILLTATLSLAACKDNDESTGSAPIIQPPPDPHAALNSIDTTGAPEGIVDLPATAPAVLTNVFARYSQTTIAGAGRIHFLAQSGVSNETHFRARRVLEQHLANVAGTTNGADKSAVRAAIATADTAFVLFRDAASADPTLPAVVAFRDAFPGFGQLIATDAIVEGSPEYMAIAPAYDATLSSTARFALNAAGTSLDAFRGELVTREAAAESALLYVPDSNTQDVAGDFMARTLEVYYGIWGHDPLGNGHAGASDDYAFHTRAAMETGDPATFALIESFFAPFHTYPAFLTDGFTGTFESAFDVNTPYTHRSRYLTKVGLRGSVGARINGNALGGTYQGGLGDDDFMGGAGDDFIEGGSTVDFDRAFYSGPASEYLVAPSPFGGGATQVLDTNLNRDGTDQIRFVEQLVFSDMTIDL